MRKIMPIIPVFTLLLGIGAASSQTPADGFVAKCTDTSGSTMEVYGIGFGFSYSYSAPGEWYPFPPRRVSSDNIRRFFPVEINNLIICVPFADIQRVEFNHKNSRVHENPDVEIETFRGERIVGRLAHYGIDTAQCIKGNTELGEFALYISKVYRLEFLPDKANNPKTERFDVDMRIELDSGLTVQATTLNGAKHILSDACSCYFRNGYTWVKKKTMFNFRIGESATSVEFQKIGSLSLATKENMAASMYGNLTMNNGDSYKILIDTYDPDDGDLYLGGKVDLYGPSFINLRMVKYLEIVNN